VSFVLDNSVALTWCFEDERTPVTTALLERVGEVGALAPGLWPLEALNGLLIAERRGRLDSPQRRRLPLATLDRDLRAAATALGLTVLGS